MNTQLNDNQYANSGRYNARVLLNKTFSTNPESKFNWIFRHFPQESDLKILELGCGTGLFWIANQHLIPESWRIILSDYSAGMLETTRQAVQGVRGNFSFEVLNAQEIAKSAQEFDVILANNMLYHLDDRPRAIASIHRVLKDDGVFLASTMGRADMAELNRLLSTFLKTQGRDFEFQEFAFSLENGSQQLAESFSKIERHDFPDALVIDQVDPIIDYYTSFNDMHDGLMVLAPAEIPAFKTFLSAILGKESAIRVAKSSGLFICSK